MRRRRQYEETEEYDLNETQEFQPAYSLFEHSREEYGEEDDPGEAYEDYDPEEDEEEEPEKEKKPEPHSIFKPDIKRPNFVITVLVHSIRVLVLLAFLAGVGALGAVIGIAKGYVDTAPDLDMTVLDGQAQTSFIYDCNGNLITEYKGTENRVSVSLQAMPTYLRNAFIAVEDARFYSHSGVDLKRILGAFVSNLTSSSTQGGSTITQQLIKNTLLSSEQSYKRKIQEAYLSLQLEARYSKDEILENYLNTIYLGEDYYGVYVAAQGYFGKDLGELTLRECAMLAGVTNSPYYYNPRRNYYTRSKEGVDYPTITNNRTDYVLRCMYENQFITWDQYQEALDPSTAHVLQDSPLSGNAMYPYAHYVEYAVGEVVDIFLEINGLENTKENRARMENKFRTGGYHVMLAIDPTVQETVESTLENWNRYPSLRDPADKTFRSKNSDGTYTELTEPQAACAVLDYRTGELKAIVGSRTKVTARKTLNRATDMKMPVGSSIKPIAVYAPALELGASPATVVYNMPLPIYGWKDSKGNDSWPKNYGGAGYTGPETMRKGMAQSHNTAAAYTLMNMVGVDNSVYFLHKLGVDDAHIDATPFGLSLGSSGITPLQMTVAYGVLANSGIYQEPISVLGISDSNGDVVWDGHAHQDRYRVFSDSTAYMVVDMMKTVVSSGTGTQAKIKGQVVAGKTGTNSDQRGVFFAGMTGYYSSALWIGHDNYKPLSSKSTGSGAAAPLWQAYMSKLHTGLGKREILDGDASDYGLVRVETCSVSGKLATDACRGDPDFEPVKDYWKTGTQPTEYCDMHITQTVCTETGMIASPYCPYTETRGVITVPISSYLYRFVGTRYQADVEKYLGPVAATGGLMCSLHNENYQGSTLSPTARALIGDAQILLDSAQGMLSGMDTSSPQYRAIYEAGSYLQSVISSDSPSETEISAAMASLTQAMSGIY